MNILASPWYIFTTIIVSLLPDVDHSKSVMGKIFLPFSKFINRRFGHRTITYSLIALMGSPFYEILNLKNDAGLEYKPKIENYMSFYKPCYLKEFSFILDQFMVMKMTATLPIT